MSVKAALRTPQLKCIIALALVLASSGCGDGDSGRNSDSTIEAMVEVGARDAVKAKLRDPDSAIFSDVFVSRRSGSPIACGKVNSRNGFGGMTGAQRFISNGANLAFLEEEMADGTIGEVWGRFC